MDDRDAVIDCAVCGIAMLGGGVRVACDDCAAEHGACDACAQTLVPEEEGYRLLAA